MYVIRKIIKILPMSFFFKSGPLAILPIKRQSSKNYSSSIIWTNDKEYSDSLNILKIKMLKEIIEEKTYKYLGTINKIHNKKLFNLSAHLNTKFYDRRLVYIGDAAHSIHPIAGQGWNIGVRDIKNLLNVILEGKSLGLDIGDPFICKKFHDLSFQDAFSLYQITDKLNSIFLQENILLKSVRNKGFEIINVNNNINNYISSFCYGHLNFGSFINY